MIPHEVKEKKPLEAEPAEEIGVEESVEIPSISEAPSEKPEEKHIRFAEEILVEGAKSKNTRQGKKRKLKVKERERC